MIGLKLVTDGEFLPYSVILLVRTVYQRERELEVQCLLPLLQDQDYRIGDAIKLAMFSD